MLSKPITCFVFGCLLAVNNGWALAKECIQAPSRIASCPNLIFKRAALAVPSLDINKHEMICICLSDINRKVNPDANSIKDIEQRIVLKRIAVSYGLSEEEIIKLVKY